MNSSPRPPQSPTTKPSSHIQATVGKAWQPPPGIDGPGVTQSQEGLSGTSKPFQGWMAQESSLLSKVGKALRIARSILELVVSLIIALVSPLAFVFLIASHAKWALTLGVLSTVVHVAWRTRFDGWKESASQDSIGLKGHAKLLFLVLSLNCVFWALLLASLIPPAWISEFNAIAPAWLADHNWDKWSGPFSATIEAFVTGALVELLARLLALLPLVLVPVLVILFVIRFCGPRTPDQRRFVYFVFYVLIAAYFVCSTAYYVFGDAIDGLFWGINGYILWRGGEWLTLFSVLVIGFIPFRIVALLRTGSWLRDFFAQYEKQSKDES